MEHEHPQSADDLPDMNATALKDDHYPPTVIHSSWDPNNPEKLLGMLMVRIHPDSHQAYHIVAESTYRGHDEMVVVWSEDPQYVGHIFTRQPEESDGNPVDLITHNDPEVNERR